MSLRSLFAVDSKLEQEGVEFTYVDQAGNDVFRVRLARAGGTNHRYDKVRDRVMEPYRRLKDLDPKLKGKLSQAIFAEAVALPDTWYMKERDGLKAEGNVFGLADGEMKWAPNTPSTRTADGFVKGLAIDDEVLSGTKEQAAKLFAELPEIFSLLATTAFDVDTYRAEDLEDDSKN